MTVQTQDVRMTDKDIIKVTLELLGNQEAYEKYTLDGMLEALTKKGYAVKRTKLITICKGLGIKPVSNRKRSQNSNSVLTKKIDDLRKDLLEALKDFHGYSVEADAVLCSVNVRMKNIEDRLKAVEDLWKT
jgi:hypothetical protein